MCQLRPAETAGSIATIRGFLIFYQRGRVTYVGCIPCVRRALLGEMPRTLLRVILLPPGWLSVPFHTFPQILLQVLLLKPEPDAVIRVSNGEAPKTKAASQATMIWIFLLLLAVAGWIAFMAIAFRH